MTSKIDFIVAGVQKAGTTALFDYLADDPSYALSKAKEVHFFDDERVEWSQPDYSSYHACFDWTRPAIRGEATPIYIYWPRALERIARYNPRIKLIVMLRDPIERAWSHWRMETSRGVETNTFSWCIREGRRRLLEGKPWGAHREFSYVERGFYGEQLERALGLFAREQLLLLEADDLRRSPDKVLQSVAAFLHAPAPPSVEAREVHVGVDLGQSLPAIDREFLADIYAADQRRLGKLKGQSRPITTSGHII